MAGDAGNVNRLVFYKGSFRALNAQMTFVTEHRPVSAIQLESTGIVVKLRNLPDRGSMTARAVGNIVQHELFTMNIFVTRLTISPNTGKTHGLNVLCLSNIGVTLHAGYLHMSAFKRELALGMIVSYLVPRFHRMAEFATGGGHRGVAGRG